MKKLYQITFDAAIKRDELTAFLETVPGCSNWMYSIPNSVFVFSQGNAANLFHAIDNRFKDHGRFFVTEVPRRNCEGWIPRSHWITINNNRIVHDYMLNFDGYWLDGNEMSLPNYSGVYCVYAAVPNHVTRSVTLQRILYIGQSVDIRARHTNHEAKLFWKSRLKMGESLCYSTAHIAKSNLDACEAALIFKLKPECNSMEKETFAHGATRVVTKGANALLPGVFEVGV